MIQIRISKFSESFIHVDAERSVLMELSDRFSFTVPNASFLPAVKNRFWDGKIRLLNLRTQNIYFGLHSSIKEFCEQNEYECIYQDPLDVEYPFSVDEFRKMVASLRLSTLNDEGKRVEITPHDYQEQGIIHALQAGRSLLLSPTASGKSLMIYILMRYFLAKTTKKVLIIVPTTNLVQQLFSDFKDYSEYVKWDVEKTCHQIYDGGEKHTDKRVVISTWQALAVKERIPDEIMAELKETKTAAQIKAIRKKWNKQAAYILEDDYFAEFGTVFGDECHLFASEDNQGGGELNEIMSKLCNAKYRVGTTGTLKDSKVNHLILEGIFGKVYQTTTTKEMMDQKKAAQLYIKCLQLQYSDEERKAMRKKTYQEEIDFLISHKGRNKFIRNLALSLKGNTLVLFERVEKHGKILHEMLDSAAETGRKVFFVAGETPTDERNAVRSIVEKEPNAIIVASYGTFSTGVNIRNIDNMIFASAGKAKIRVLQSIGRGLRLSVRKWMVTLYDIVDDLSCWNKAGTQVNDNYAMQHFTERVNFYNEEQFEYRMYKIQLESGEGVLDE